MFNKASDESISLTSFCDTRYILFYDKVPAELTKKKWTGFRTSVYLLPNLLLPFGEVPNSELPLIADI